MVLKAPVSFHRIVFRRGQKAALVVAADRLLIVGLALLIPAICSAVLLILDVVLGLWQAILGSALTAPVGLVHLVRAPAGHPPFPSRPRRRTASAAVPAPGRRRTGTAGGVTHPG